MTLTMKQRQAVTAVTVQRYRQSSKKVKRQILDEFCETTGYCRGYARYVLRNHGRQVWLGGKRTIVGGIALVRLGSTGSAQFTFPQASEVAHQAGSVSRAGTAAPTMIKGSNRSRALLAHRLRSP